jgi:cell wall-associated NlpC family hydrolase
VASRRIALAALAAGCLVLGACARRADRDDAQAPAAQARATAGGSSGSPIVSVVPATDDLIQRASAGGALIGRLLEAAKPSLGTPYRFGGTDPDTGIDCSNFTWLLYRRIGVPYERYLRTRELSTLRRNAGFIQTTFADAQPGDLLVYGHRDAGGEWHGHVVILVDKEGQLTGHAGLVLGAHGTPVSAVAFVTAAGFADGWFRTPEMRLLNVLRPVEPPRVR